MTLVNKDNFVLFEGRSEKGFSAPHLLEKFLSSFPTVIWDLSTVDPLLRFLPERKKISHVNSFDTVRILIPIYRLQLVIYTS